MTVLVVPSGYKIYQDDMERFLVVTDGHSVISGNNLYVTEKDYTRRDKDMSDAFSYYTYEEPDSVTISKKEYRELLEAKKKLEALKQPAD